AFVIFGAARAAPLLEILDAVELRLGAGLRRVPGCWIADEVLGHARELLLVRRRLRDLRIAHAHDLAQALVAGAVLQVLAALLLDLRALRVGVGALSTSPTTGRQRDRDPEA